MQAAERAATAASPRAIAAYAYAFGALAALAFALSFPLSEDFVAGWPLVFAWPALLGASVRLAASWKSAAMAAGVPFFAAFLAHEWWMHAVTVLGMPVLVAYLAVWTVVLALVVRTLGGTRQAPRAPFILALPVALVSIEFLRGDLVCTGYAWFFAAHPLVEWPAVAQVASIGGGWMLSALAAVVAGGALDACVARGARRIWSPVAAAACLGAAVAFGAARIAAHDAVTTPPERALLVVQTNLPMSNKLAWEPAAQVEDFVAFARLTIEGAAAARKAGDSFDAAIWPETMVPGFGLEPESIRALLEGRYFPGDRFEEGLRDLSSRIGAPLVVGSPAFLRLRAEGQRWAWDRQFNSAYLVDATGARGRTDKIFLTPFGETMPIISNWDWLEQRLLDLGASGMTFDLDAAASPSTLAIEAGAAPLRMGVPICFEITKPWASRTIAFDGEARRADVLVNISNDGWFSASKAGRRQHLQVAQLRAAELATPVVRAANTGISASIDATGRLEGSLGAVTEGTLVARFRPATGTPLAARVGDGFAFGMLALAVLGCALARRVKSA
jgi:apolipoprotein N-acyltransferase